MATIAELLKCKHQLDHVSDTAVLDVELLLSHCLKKSRTYLKAWGDQGVDPSVQHQFEKLLARRQQGEPVAYLLGHQGFWSIDLEVNSSTLIPRPETELLVEKSLSLIGDKQAAKVLDLGTGTGAIALALAVEKNGWQILAVDKEAAAVALAEKNRKKLLTDRTNVEIKQSDWFSDIELQKFHLIVSNPPYIDQRDPHLRRGDVRFEPESALIASKEGLGDIETIVQQAPEYLSQGGWLLFEHGFDQGSAVRSFMQNNSFEQVFTDRDLAGLERITGGCFI